DQTESAPGSGSVSSGRHESACQTVTVPEAEMTYLLPSGDQAGATGQPLHSLSPGGTSWRTSPVLASQRRNQPSVPPPSRVLPSGDQVSPTTGHVPAMVRSNLPSPTPQVRTVESLPAEASVFPSGDQATASAASWCPFRVCRRVPSSASHTPTVL